MSRTKKPFVRICASSNFSRVNTFISVTQIKHKIGYLTGNIKPCNYNNLKTLNHDTTH